MRDISSIIVIRSDQPDAEFISEVNAAVAQGYTTILSSSSEGDWVRFLLAEGRGSGSSDGGSGSSGSDKSEFVIAITGTKTNLLVSIVGNYTLGGVTKDE
jgi:hypothetical protein